MNCLTLPNWSKLLEEAVRKPGLVMQAYHAFHRYSTGNQLLALWQCEMRGLQPGPINTFPGWQALGRHVKKGERALMLCMPITCKRRADSTVKDSIDEEPDVITAFVYKARWFVLAQTEGEDMPQVAIPHFDADLALSALNIKRIAFDEMDGNCQGFARRREIAISPLAQLPHKTFFHEVGHVLLGHTAQSDLSDTDYTPCSLGEVEAEAIALLCCESLGLEGAAYCRDYIQGWMKRGNGSGHIEIPEKSAQKIFRVTDQILHAGREAETPLN